MLPRAFRLEELDAAGIGEGLFRRIDDLHAHGPARALPESWRAFCGTSAIGLQQIGQHHDFRERRGREGRRQARALAGVVDHGLRHPVDDVAACGRAHQAGNADALAALDQHFGQRKRDDQRAVELAFPRRGGEANTIEGERSGQIQTVCAASHSCSRT